MFAIHNITYFISANHADTWKCVSVLKGDGTQAHHTESIPAPVQTTTSSQTATTRYFKLGTISHPSQVPWH